MILYIFHQFSPLFLLVLYFLFIFHFHHVILFVCVFLFPFSETSNSTLRPLNSGSRNLATPFLICCTLGIDSMGSCTVAPNHAGISQTGRAFSAGTSTLYESEWLLPPSDLKENKIAWNSSRISPNETPLIKIHTPADNWKLVAFTSAVNYCVTFPYINLCIGGLKIYL
jgi:hypothetical protein